jgi:putative membrane protein
VVPRGKAFVMSVLSTVVAQHGNHDDMMGGSGWWWLWGTLMLIVVLAAIALVAWLIVRSVQSRADGARSARDILNERYARGEIDTDEYEERLSKLR